MKITVRYFAAAAAAAGTDTETVDAPTGASVTELTRHLAARGPELAQVLARCSFLRDGFAVRDPSVPLGPGSVLDVLPPFAGG